MSAPYTVANLLEWSKEWKDRAASEDAAAHRYRPKGKRYVYLARGAEESAALYRAQAAAFDALAEHITVGALK